MGTVVVSFLDIKEFRIQFLEERFSNVYFETYLYNAPHDVYKAGDRRPFPSVHDEQQAQSEATGAQGQQA